MTSRHRLLTVLRGEIPDCVPVSPDISNMIPARLTGKPFWDIYLYNDPPIRQAYVTAARYFDIDAMSDGQFPLRFPEETPEEPPMERFIVHRGPDRIVTQMSWLDGGMRHWKPTVDVFYVADSPSYDVTPDKVALPTTPVRYEPVEGVKPVDNSPAGLKAFMNAMGDQGLVGIWLASSVGISNEADLYRYIDNPDKHEAWAVARVEAVERRFQRIMAMDFRPDFLCVGGSGTLVFQSLDIFKTLCWPAVKRAIELANGAGFFTHIHSCGPEKDLVKMMP